MGIIFNIGRSCISCLGCCFIKQLFFLSQPAPSKNRPETKHPVKKKRYKKKIGFIFIIRNILILQRCEVKRILGEDCCPIKNYSTIDKLTLVGTFRDVIRICILSDIGIKRGFIQGPSILTTSCLYQSCQV